MSTLSIRLFSAVIAVSVLFSTAYWGGSNGLYIITGLVIFVCSLEFAQFLRPAQFTRQGSTLTFTVSTIGIFIASYFSLDYILPAFWLSSLMLVVFWLFKIRTDRDLKRFFRTLCFAVLGLFYLGILPALTAQILHLEHGPGWMITLLAIVFFGDTGAYFIGSNWGRRHLFPLISPNKTWEGALGGVLGSILLGGLFAYLLIPHVSWPLFILVAAFCGVLGQIGDLFESLVKRVANVKDSGSIMPGHGGMLDRIDGVLFAGPTFYYLTVFFLI